MKKIVCVFVEQAAIKETRCHLNEVVKLLLAERTVGREALLHPKQLRRHLHRLPLIPSADSYIFIRKPDIRFILEHLPE